MNSQSQRLGGSSLAFKQPQPMRGFCLYCHIISWDGDEMINHFPGLAEGWHRSAERAALGGEGGKQYYGPGNWWRTITHKRSN